MRLRLYRALFLILAGLIIFPTVLQAQQKELKVLFVGNSYTYGNNLAHIVSILSDSTETKLITRKSVIGGAYLREHWNGNRELKTREIIAGGDFDIVVLQDNSMAAIFNPDSTVKFVKLFAEYNERYGAETYLFNTWAREKVPQFQAEIDAVYLKAARKSGAIRVPVGPAGELPLYSPRTFMVEDAAGETLRLLGADPLDYEFCKRIAHEIIDE